jgi:rhamnose transport system ATP-binding protein
MPSDDRRSGAGPPLVEVRGIHKRFGGNHALDDVSLSIMPGTVHALVGENGAGKSTLGKVIAGAVAADEGEILVDGRPVAYRAPADALADGIALIHQEIALAPDLTVVENVMLGAEEGRFGLLGRRAPRARFRRLLEQTGWDLPADVPVRTLRLGQQQEVAILWALARNARLIVMDEPTAALAKPEAQKLQRVIRQLRDAGLTIVFVSHFLEEVLAVADLVTVMRNGRHVETIPAEGATVQRLIVGMLGQRLESTFPERSEPPAGAEAVLSVEGLSQPGVLSDISLEVGRGEIVGIFGLMGSGRSELAHAIAGAGHGVTGEVAVEGRPVRLRTPREAIRHGITLLPESRKDQGLFLVLSQAANAVAASVGDHAGAGVGRRGSERAAAERMLRSLQVHPHALDGSVDALSGGNQQKVLFAKVLLTAPKVLILDEPTRGVDVGAKLAIYELIVRLAADGCAVLMISSELEEVTHLSHRVIVMRGGTIVATRDAGTDPDVLLSAAFGVTERSQVHHSRQEAHAS